MTRTVIVLFSLLVVTSGCDGLRKKLFEKKASEAAGSEVTVDEKGRVNLKATDDAGSQTQVQFGEGTTLPADFPKSVPIYPGAKIIAVVSMGSRKDAYMVTIDTKAKPSEVIDFYKKAKGFKIESDLALGKTHMLSLTASDGLDVTISVTTADDGTADAQITTTR